MRGRWAPRVRGKGSEWRSANRRRQLQTRTTHHGDMPPPPPPPSTRLRAPWYVRHADDTPHPPCGQLFPAKCDMRCSANGTDTCQWHCTHCIVHPQIWWAWCFTGTVVLAPDMPLSPTARLEPRTPRSPSERGGGLHTTSKAHRAPLAGLCLRTPILLRTALKDSQPPTANPCQPLFSTVSVVLCLAHVLTTKQRLSPFVSVGVTNPLFFLSPPKDPPPPAPGWRHCQTPAIASFFVLSLSI